MGTVAGLLLAAGGGRRMGRPKALVGDPSGEGTLLQHGIAVLREAGCEPVIAVVGAAAAEAAALADGADRVVEAPDWAEGQSASLRAGLVAAGETVAESLAVLLVDLPDVGSAVLARVIQAAGAGPDTLARATYRGVPGHPVLLGRTHWAGVLASARGDQGARDYLSRHAHLAVECGDLATGRDVDRPADLET